MFVSLILISGVSLVYAVELHPACPTGYEWDSELQKCIITPGPIEPGEELEKFSPNIAVWFKLNVTKNEAIDLIESFDLSDYKLSEPGWDEESWLDNIGEMAVIEVPQGSEQEYIQKFKESDIVETADLNIVYEPNKQNEQKRGGNNLILIISIIAVIIFVLFLVWYKLFHKKIILSARPRTLRKCYAFPCLNPLGFRSANSDYEGFVAFGKSPQISASLKLLLIAYVRRHILGDFVKEFIKRKS